MIFKCKQNTLNNKISDDFYKPIGDGRVSDDLPTLLKLGSSVVSRGKQTPRLVHSPTAVSS